MGTDEAFYFFTDIDKYTGQSASSLEEFLGRIKEVDAKSLEFHLFREDFEKWASSTLVDIQLSKDIAMLRKHKAAGVGLRDRLSSVVSKRLKELKAPLQPEDKKQVKKKEGL